MLSSPGLLLLLAVTLTVPIAVDAESAPQVKTETGIVEGRAKGPVHAFLGIPYAAPPIGELRWKPPAPPEKWSGVRKATEFGARCMQGRLFADMVFRDRGPSEDCLTLNVWAPAKWKAKLPVMLWIYGGGFAAGGTSEPRQDGRNLAKRGVVVVSMNYRLGVFGFFVHPGLAEESGKGAAGNYGLLDQVAALEWVQRNVAAFGGDPGNVTIFGESAGSFSVSALMASPLARGLFHKAIGESGAAFYSHGLPFKTLEEREPEDLTFAESALGVKTVAELRKVSAQTVLEASLKKREGQGDLRFSPVVDGYLLLESVPALFAQDRQNDVSLLAGWNRDEGNSSVSEKMTIADLKTRAQKEFGARDEEFLRLYPGRSDEEARRSLEDFAGDQFIAWSTWKWMEAQKTTGRSPVYRYRFDFAVPADLKNHHAAAAYHSAEIEYVFGQLDWKDLPWRTEDWALSTQLQNYWVNFAHQGDPNGVGLPKWPAYEADSGWAVMHLGVRSEAAKDDLRGRYVFLDGIWGRP